VWVRSDTHGAVWAQLGLNLTEKQANANVFVFDHVEKAPTAKLNQRDSFSH